MWPACIFLAVILAGCSPTRPGQPSPTTAAVLPDSSTTATAGPRGLDLNRRFRFSAGVGSSTLAPLSFAQQLARSGGGTWVVFASKPLEDVKWRANDNGTAPSGTVKESLEILRKAGTPIAWDSSKGYMLLNFAPPRNIELIRAAPPVETVGVLLSGETIPDVLKAVSDVWRIHIEATPDLVQRRNTYVAARHVAARDAGDTTPLAALMYRYGSIRPSEDSAEQPGRIEFKAIKRLEVEGLLRLLAQSLGGDARSLGQDRWQLAPLSDTQKVETEIARLKGVIDQAASTVSIDFSSYGSRSSGISGSQPDADPPTIPGLNEEATAAFDSLGIYGAPAIPALTAYLDAAKPQLAQPAMETLAAMPNPEAHAALVEFERKLQVPTTDRTANAVRPVLQERLVRNLARSANPETSKLLADISLDEKEAPQVRLAARMAIVKTGDLARFTAAPVRELGTGENEFLVRYPPEIGRPEPMKAAEDRATIAPLATTRTKDGDVWAVFLSGRLGNPNDLWLARGRDHKWIDFTFTGQTFARSRNYGGGDIAPGPGACTLEVSGDRIVIRPPNTRTATEVQQLTKQMADPKLTAVQRNTLSMKYYKLAQQLANVIEKPITLTLADLRRDSDNDGLADLVELRLGLDPHNADTDGDGIPDSKDANPLAGPEAGRTDRGHILQAVFTALYGGDMSSEPILVVLDRANWQEFYGAHGRVICITPEDLLQSGRRLGSLRMLQFGGPHDSESTILKKDGPCLFNDAHSRAEVHFWQWTRHKGGAGAMYGRMRGMSDEPTPQEFVAKFERGSEWKMTSVKPSRIDTADRAAAELQGAMNDVEY